jgi:type IV secretory pathway VirB10-like protein
MFSNRAAFALLAVACVAAAGGGAYLATRQGARPSETVEASQAANRALNEAKPVQETEAVIGTPAPAEPPPASVPPTSAASPRKRQEAPSRPAPKPVRKPETAAGSSQLPALDRSWPSGGPADPAPPSSSTSPAEASAPVPEVEERPQEPVRAPEPPAPAFEELVVSADSVIGVQVETALNSETARVEDRVEAHVVRDVRAGGSVAIPAGSRALGSVTLVERGGKFKERARLGIRFHTLVLADGTRLPITTEPIYRTGEAPGQGTAAKIGGGTVVGAILGAIAGGAKGAAIGAAAGGGAGTAAVAVGDRKPATFAPGTEVTAKILSPVTVTVEK